MERNRIRLIATAAESVSCERFFKYSNKNNLFMGTQKQIKCIMYMFRKWNRLVSSPDKLDLFNPQIMHGFKKTYSTILFPNSSQIYCFFFGQNIVTFIC